MSTRDLSEKYGRGNSHALINRAIRAEIRRRYDLPEPLT